MSDLTRQRMPQRDAGMTLPELLITTMVAGLVMVVLTAGISVTLRQSADTRGRVDVARWEQNLGMWLPDDLTSARADQIRTDPEATPCGDDQTSCGGVPIAGSNVLLLTWSDGASTTWVSYRYQADGESFALYRVACTDGSCTNVRVLGDLAAPTNPDGTPLVPAWTAGDPVPGTVIDVDYPTVAGGTDGSVVCPETVDPTADPCDRSIGQRRVVVSVNGEPAFDGTPRTSRISVSAGGAKLDTLATPTFTAPSATPARTECGGPITLVVDTSGSIGEAGMVGVRDGLTEVVNTLTGTPTLLQIVTFSNKSDALGPGTGWNEYFDMSNPTNATTLKNAIAGLRHGGSTNWEDALFRTFFNADGKPHSETGIPTAPMPELVVLFTDGLPTVHRATGSSYKSDGASSSLTIPAIYNYGTSYDKTVSEMSPLGWYRAANLMGSVLGNETYGSAIRVMGIGVGPEFARERQMYTTNNFTNRTRNGVAPAQLLPSPWPTGSTKLEHEGFLGNLLVGDEAWVTGSDTTYVKREWNSRTLWGDLTDVDLLMTENVARGASALSDIVLAQCGGTLTLQTKLNNGSNAPFNVTYTMDGTSTVTTSRGVRSGTFDVTFDGQTGRTVQIVPDAKQIQLNGQRPMSWSCFVKGEPLTASRYPLIDDDAGAAGGISISINANEAVSCSLNLAP